MNLYTSPCNQYCKVCVKGRNTLNGRYCTQLKKMVELAKEPPCINE